MSLKTNQIEGAFGKKTVMKSDTHLQRHMDVDEPAPTPPPVQPEPSAASSSQAAPFSDAVMNALDRITQRINSMDTFWHTQYQVLDNKVDQAKTLRSAFGIWNLMTRKNKCCVSTYYAFQFINCFILSYFEQLCYLFNIFKHVVVYFISSFITLFTICSAETNVVQIIILASARIICNIALCKCEVDPTWNCVAKINLYSN